MAEPSSQHTRSSRRGRQLLSIDLSADDASSPSSYQASAIPQQAFASTATVAAPHATQSFHAAASSVFPPQHVEVRTSRSACATSELLHGSTCPATSSRLQQSLPSLGDPPALHAPRAIPGVQSSSIPLGPIRQPLQGGPPCHPLYIARALAQAPLPQTQQLHSGWNASQLSESQQRVHQRLTAARAIGFCQGVRQNVIQILAPAPLTFSRQQGPSSGQKAAQHQSDNTGQQASLGDSMSAHPASGQKRSSEAAGLTQSSSKRQRLVHIAEPQQSAPPPAHGLIKFKCSIVDILNAHWPGAVSQAAPGQHIAEGPSTACSSGLPPVTSRGQQVKAELPSAGAVPCRALPSSLGRGPSRRLLSVPSCNAASPTLLPPASVLAASADAMAATTTAFESLNLGSKAQSRRAMPPPQRATAQSVQPAVVAAQAAGWAPSPNTAALQSSMGSASHTPQSHGRQGSVTFREPPRSQAVEEQPPGFALSSYPQVMSQLLSEPSMHAMQAWVAAYQPPSGSSSQQAIMAANHSPARPQKRARQGIDSQQALPAAADRSSAAAAAASTALMFGNLPPQQLPLLSSIQLLHLRAQQHIAHANASSVAVSASVGSSNSHAIFGGACTQTHLQPQGLQPQTASSGSPNLPPPSRTLRGLTPHPLGDPMPSQSGSIRSSLLVGRSQPPGNDAGFSQFVYAPAGTRPRADEAMQALLDCLSQERTAKRALPSLTPAAAGPLPPPAAAPPPPSAPQAPPASGLASLTLLDGMPSQERMGSSLSQHQQPDRVASQQRLGVQELSDSCASPLAVRPELHLPRDNGRTASQPQSEHPVSGSPSPDPPS